MAHRLGLALATTAAALLLPPPEAAHAASGEPPSHPAKREHMAVRHRLIMAHRPPAQAPRQAEANRLISWIAASRDNGSLPYAVIDKQAATLFLFAPSGEPLGSAPVLIGISPGDDSTPGIGSKRLAEIGPAERTTPAGRFLARYGVAAGGEQVLWVDYANSVAMHAVITSHPRERRLQRLRSPDPEDRRISFGCINLPTLFYQETIRPLFQGEGGYVYILPDTKPLEMVFPRLLTMAALAAGGTHMEMNPTPSREPQPAD